jgi:reactive chlorine resistance protein C
MRSTNLSIWGARLEAIGGAFLRYGLVAILLYYGTVKFTAEEAKAIEPLVANSPLFSWLHAAVGRQGISNAIGVAEIVIALLIVARPFWPEASALGSILSIGMFLSTLSFLLSTPGLWHFAEWYPLPLPTDATGFLMKDFFLLGAALWSAGEALRAARRRATSDLPQSLPALHGARKTGREPRTRAGGVG